MFIQENEIETDVCETVAICNGLNILISFRHGIHQSASVRNMTLLMTIHDHFGYIDNSGHRSKTWLPIYTDASSEWHISSDRIKANVGHISTWYGSDMKFETRPYTLYTCVGIFITQSTNEIHIIPTHNEELPWKTLLHDWWQWRHKTSINPSRLFVQQFIQADMKIKIKTPHHWPFCWGEFTVDRSR